MSELRLQSVSCCSRCSIFLSSAFVLATSDLDGGGNDGVVVDGVGVVGVGVVGVGVVGDGVGVVGDGVGVVVFSLVFETMFCTTDTGASSPV